MKFSAKLIFLFTSVVLATSAGAASAPLPDDLRIGQLAPEKKGLFALAYSLVDTMPFYSDSSALYRSDDSGKSWTFLRSISAPYAPMTENDSYVFLQMSDSILRSADSGKSWVKVYPAGTATSGNIMAMATLGPTVLVGTESFGVVRSIDNGDHWLDTPDGLDTVTVWELATNGANVFANLDATVYNSTDSGKSWSRAINTEDDFYIGNFKSIGKTLVGFGYNDTTFFRSTDSGKTWQENHTGILFPAEVNDFVNAFVVGDNAMFMSNPLGVFRSLDEGLSWVLYANLDGVFAMAVVGDKLLVSTPSGLVTLDVHAAPTTAISSPSIGRQGFSLKQNLTIKNGLGTFDFSVQKQGHVVIGLYNSQGSKIRTVIDGNYPAGVHQVNFNTNALAHGSYFLRASSVAGIQAQPFQLLR